MHTNLFICVDIKQLFHCMQFLKINRIILDDSVIVMRSWHSAFLSKISLWCLRKKGLNYFGKYKVIYGDNGINTYSKNINGSGSQKVLIFNGHHGFQKHALRLLEINYIAFYLDVFNNSNYRVDFEPVRYDKIYSESHNRTCLLAFSGRVMSDKSAAGFKKFGIVLWFVIFVDVLLSDVLRSKHRDQFTPRLHVYIYRLLFKYIARFFVKLWSVRHKKQEVVRCAVVLQLSHDSQFSSVADDAITFIVNKFLKFRDGDVNCVTFFIHPKEYNLKLLFAASKVLKETKLKFRFEYYNGQSVEIAYGCSSGLLSQLDANNVKIKYLWDKSLIR